MKRRILIIGLCAEAVLCIVLSIAQINTAAAAGSILLFPFGWIGLGLGKLALLGRFGNAAALMLCTAVSLIPILYFFREKTKRTMKAADALLLMTAIGSFTAIYFSANPNLLYGETMQGEAGEMIVRGIMNIFVLSMILCYAVLRILETSREGGMLLLRRYLNGLLICAAVIFVYLAFASSIQQTAANINAVNKANTMGDNGMSIAFLVMRGIVSALPWMLDIVTVLLVIGLITDYGTENAEKAADRLQKWCVKALTVTLIAQMICNLLQILFAGMIRDISVNAELPIFSIIFALAAMIAARIIGENCRLKRENDLFI